MKFTSRAIAALRLPPGKDEVILFDDALGGFGLRLRSSGASRWVYQYKLGSKQRRLTIGNYPALGLEAARKIAAELAARVRLGGDPAGDKAEARAESAMTFERVAHQFLAARKETLRPRSYAEVERHLAVHAKPLHREPLAKIDRSRIAALIAGLPTNKFHTHASISAFFSWAVREGYVDVNPVMATNKPPKPASRKRTLSEEELRDVWRALEDDDFGDIVRLLALTGARRDEIGSLCWSEVDLEAALVRLPSDRTKNGRPFDLPLGAATLSILRTRQRDEDRDFVFGRGKGGFSGWSACKRRLDARIAALRKAEGKPVMQPWALHDLRRTFSTMAHDKLSVEPHHVEACLNHISGHQGGVAGVYNHALYREQKRQALNAWNDFVMRIVEGRDNVIPLRA
jgi:integrase